MGDVLPPGFGDSCVVCPARYGLGPGQFDVVDGPGVDFKLDRAVGWRVDRRTRTAVCVHPFRIGIAPGRYVSGGEPVPEGTQPRPVPSRAALVMPEDVTDLEGWLVAVLRVAAPDELFAAVGEAEQAAGARFAPGAVTEALRRVLSHELAYRD